MDMCAHEVIVLKVETVYPDTASGGAISDEHYECLECGARFDVKQIEAASQR